MNVITPAETKDSRDFEKLVIWTSTFSIGVVAGFLASIKQVNPAVRFQFSFLSVIAFLAGGALTFLFLRSVLNTKKRHRALLVAIAAVAAVLGYFAFGIKHVSSDNRRDVTIGTAIALVVLSFVGWLIWRVAKFFESDQPGDGPESNSRP